MDLKQIALFFVVVCMTLGSASAAVPVIGGYFEPGGYYGGHAGHHYWVNYDPSSGRYGVLENNPKGTEEGELTSSVTDTDYDGCTGGDKYGGGARYWLIPATQAQIDAWYHPQTVASPVANNTTNVSTTQTITVEQPITFDGQVYYPGTLQYKFIKHAQVQINQPVPLPAL